MKIKTKRSKWILSAHKQWVWANHKDSPYIHLGPFVIQRKVRNGKSVRKVR